MAGCDCNGGVAMFYKRFSDDKESFIRLLQLHGIILPSKLCGKCGNDTKMDLTRGAWRCYHKVSLRKQKATKCDWSQTIYKNTFFDNASVEKVKLLCFLNSYLRKGFCYENAHDEWGLATHTINDWCSFAREVLIDWCLDNSAPIGGPGFIVEIDESKFGKRKFNVGRMIEGQWVFGGICRQTRKFFLVPVEDRGKDTLLAVLKDHVLPGTTIMSDCWRAYHCLSDHGYVQYKVNHSVNFVDPITKAHTNTIERLWRDIKARVPLYGRRKKNWVGYLARSMFMLTFKEANTRLHHFLLAAAKLYNPANPPNPTET